MFSYESLNLPGIASSIDALAQKDSVLKNFLPARDAAIRRARGRAASGAARGGAAAPLDRANFTGLVLGCIEAKFCKKINMRLKALVEIDTMHSFAQLQNHIFFKKLVEFAKFAIFFRNLAKFAIFQTDFLRKN